MTASLTTIATLSGAFLGRQLTARELESVLEEAGQAPSEASLSKAFFASEAVSKSLGASALSSAEITRRFARHVLGFEATAAQVALVEANGPKDFGDLSKALVGLIDSYVGPDAFINQIQKRWRADLKASESAYQRHEAAALVTSLSVGILGWAPDAKTLTQAVDSRMNGASEADLANQLLSTTAAREHFGTQGGAAFEVYLLTSVLGRSPSTFEIEVVRAVNITDRGLLAAALVRVLDQYTGSDAALRDSSARLQNRTELGLAVNEVLATKLTPASLSRADAAFAASRTLIGLVNENEITKDAAIAYLAKLSSAADVSKALAEISGPGRAIDGYLKDAIAFVDLNLDGLLTAGEPMVKTGASGEFNLSGQIAPIVVVGGTDVSSGKSFEGILRAPPGSAVVNPLTTVVAALVDSGRSVSAAETLVASALGIDLSKLGGGLSDFDPIAASLSSTGNRDAALQVAAAAAQVISVAVAAGSAISGAAGGEGKLSTAQASGAVMGALAAKLESAASQGSMSAPLKLSDPAIVGDLITRSAAAVVTGLASDAASAVASQSASVAQAASTVIAQTAASIDKIASTPGVDPAKALAQVTQVQIAAQTSIADQLQSAVQAGRVTSIATELSASAITALVAAAEVKALDPNSANDAALIAQSGTGTKSPETVSGSGGADTSLGAAGTDTVAAVEPPILTVAPGTLTLSGFTDSGTSSSDRISSDNSFVLELSGSQPGATVTYQRSVDGGASWATIDRNRTESLDGSYQYRAFVAIGAVSALSNVISVQIDRAVVTGTLGLVDYSDKGIAGDLISDDSAYSLTVTGAESAAAFAYERSLDGGSTWVTVGASQSGATQASISYRALITDVAGNTAYGNVLSVGYDPAAAYGVLSFGTDFQDSGLSSTDRLSNDGEFTLIHSGAGSSDTVVFERKFIPVGSSDGSWTTVAASQSLSADGSYSFRALVTQGVGGASAYTPTVGYVLDTVAATAAMVVTLTNDTANTSDRITSDGRFTLTAPVAPSGESYQAGLTVYEAKRTTEASWYTLGSATVGSVTTLVGTADGAWVFRARVTDAAGNTVYTPETASFTLDTVAPTVGALLLGNWDDTGSSNTDGLSSDAEFSLTVPFGDANGAAVAWQQQFAGSVGTSNWTAVGGGFSGGTLTLTGDGGYAFRAVVTDTAGNQTISNTVGYVLDTVGPVGAVGVAQNVNAAAAVSAGVFEDTDVAGDRITSDRNFALSVGTQESGAKVLRYEVDLPDGGESFVTGASTVTLGAVGVDQHGDVTLAAGAATGLYTFRALLEDVAGNTQYAASFTMGFQTEDGVNQFFLLPISGLSGVGGGLQHPRPDSQFALQLADLELDLSKANPSDTKASELGNALSSYLDSNASVGSSLEPLQLASPSRFLESVPALANALSDYQIANIGLVKSDQAADLLRKVKENSEAYPKPILVPPNGSS